MTTLSVGAAASACNRALGGGAHLIRSQMTSYVVPGGRQDQPIAHECVLTDVATSPGAHAGVDA